MIRSTLPLLLLLLGTLISAASAAERRVYYIGHSHTDSVRYSALEKLAATRGHKLIWGRQMIPGAPLSWNYEHPGGFTVPRFGHWRDALGGHTWDVIVLSPGISSLAGETDYARRFISFARERSPDARYALFASFITRREGDYSEGWSSVPAPGAPLVLRSHLRTWMEQFRDGTIANLPRPELVEISPNGHTFYLLDQKLKAGALPAHPSVLDFYADLGHPNNAGAYLSACTMFAFIFGESPVGLPVTGFERDPRQPGDTELTPELRDLIQQTAWEAVDGHPWTSVRGDAPPRVLPMRPPLFSAGRPIAYRLLAAHAHPPQRWQIVSGTLPAGLVLSPDGNLSGTPEKPGDSALVVAVTDARGKRAEGTLPLVIAPNIAPKATLPSLQPAYVGERSQLRLAAAGNAPLRWTAAKLPEGFSLTPGGLLAGTPTAPGPIAFRLTLRDADGEETPVNFTLDAKPPRLPLEPLRRADSATPDGRLDEPFWKPDRQLAKRIAGPAGPLPSARFDVVATPRGLAVAVIVASASPTSPDEVIELCLDPGNHRETAYNRDDLRLLVSPDGRHQLFGIEPAKLKIATQRTADGFTAEILIEDLPTPLETDGDLVAFGKWSPKPGACFGFDLGLQSGPHRLVWRGSERNSHGPADLAVLQLAP